MSFSRPVGTVFLMLALIVNGLTTGVMGAATAALASANSPDTSSGMAGEHGSCHEHAAPADPAPAPVGPVPAQDCCHGAGCSCACLQHSPAMLLTFALPDLERFSPPPVLGSLVTWPSAPTAPQLRPPIA